MKIYYKLEIISIYSFYYHLSCYVLNPNTFSQSKYLHNPIYDYCYDDGQCHKAQNKRNKRKSGEKKYEEVKLVGSVVLLYLYRFSWKTSNGNVSYSIVFTRK